MKWLKHLCLPGLISMAFLTLAGCGGGGGGGSSDSNAPVAGSAVMAFGNNNPSGQLGNGSTSDSSLPTQASSLSNIVAVSAGLFHSLAVDSAGSVWGFGANSNGQLGDGTTNDRSTPVKIAGLTNIAAVSAGGSHSLALDKSGVVWSFGANSSGQLGDGTTNESKIPKRISMPGNKVIVAISAGTSHSLVLDSDGNVWAFGKNETGQLGDTTTTDRPTPQQVQATGLGKVTAVSAGGYHSLLIDINGAVWAFGSNTYGQLGDNSNTESRIPKKIETLTVKIIAVAAGSDHSLVLDESRKLWGFGKNSYFQAGFTGSRTDQLVPVDSGLSGITAIAAGKSHSLALNSSGELYSFGGNISGQLGNGSSNNSYNSPGKITIAPVKSLSAGGMHSLVLLN